MMTIFDGNYDDDDGNDDDYNYGGNYDVDDNDSHVVVMMITMGMIDFGADGDSDGDCY